MLFNTGNYKWGDELHTRKKRLQVLTALGHDYSLMIGADCPIGALPTDSYILYICICYFYIIKLFFLLCIESC